MKASRLPTDGDTRPCPQCRNTLVFNSRYPVVAAGMALERSGSEVGDRIRYERAWVSRNGVIIESLWGMPDANIRETKNQQCADDAHRVWCNRWRHSPARIRAVLRRGCDDGHDGDDWLNAERKLSEASRSSAA